MENRGLIGVVLCGGESSRMGFNKGLIDYHGMPQKDFAFRLLEQVCSKVYYSVATINQQDNREIPDYPEYAGNGPISGILSVFDHFANHHLLVLGCDYPLISIHHLTTLVEKFEGDDTAVCYVSGESELPEPLITLYGAQFLENMKTEFLSKGSSSLRKFLMNPKVKHLKTENETHLISSDTPDKMQEVRRILSETK